MSTVPKHSAKQLADGVWTFAAGDYTCLFAETDESVVVVNALPADDLREAITDTVPGKPISHIVYAIDHLDHTSGAAALAAEATIVGHDLCARVVAGRGNDGQLPVNQVVSGASQTVELDGLRIDLLHPGPSQGTGNIAVKIAEKGVLFVVGPRADARYGLFNDFHFRHASRVWRELATDDLTTVVPGRGPLMNADGLRRAADYVDALFDAVQHAYADGVFADGVPVRGYDQAEAYVAERLTARYGDLDGFDDHIGLGAFRALIFYMTGGWGMEDTVVPPGLTLSQG